MFCRTRTVVDAFLFNSQSALVRSLGESRRVCWGPTVLSYSLYTWKGNKALPEIPEIVIDRVRTVTWYSGFLPGLSIKLQGLLVRSSLQSVRFGKEKKDRNCYVVDDRKLSYLPFSVPFHLGGNAQSLVFNSELGICPAVTVWRTFQVQTQPLSSYKMWIWEVVTCLEN